MAEENKGIRLKKAATELNVGVSTLVEFLAKKGHQVESNPNTRLTAEQYDIVATAFQAERAVKEQADKIEITPSGNNVVVEANIEERKDETDEVIIKNYNSSTVETKGTPKPVESAVTPDASQVPESKPEAPAEEVQQPAAEVAEVPAEPDKPGTTGETVNVFSKCLGGMEAKLMVLFNKCDTVASLYDFARVYGNVCWNLARVLQTKDLPKIWTIYSGEERDSAGAGIPLADFNHQRGELRDIIVNDAAARRRDNVFSQTQRDFLGLSIRMRIVNRFMRTLVLRVALTLLGGALLAPICFFGISLLLPKAGTVGPMFAQILGALAAVLVLAAAFWLRRPIKQFTCFKLARDLDQMFEKEYRVEMTVGTHDDLKQIWADIRDETSMIIREGLLEKLPFFGEFCRRRLEAYIGYGSTNAVITLLDSRIG